MIRFISVGQLRYGETCFERYRILLQKGWEGKQFNILPYMHSGGRIRRAVQHRLLVGPDVSRFNDELVEFINGNRDVDVVWIDKGRWLYCSTLLKIKELTGAILVHYTPDPAFTVHTSRHFKKCLRLYDLCITTKKYEIDEYKKAGARSVVFALQGIDDRFSKCASCTQEEGRSGLVFIGHCEPHYVRTLSALAEEGVRLNIRGDGWEKVRSGSTPLSRCVQGGAAMGDDYPKALSQGKIGVGLLSKMCPDAFTTRTFEIPASGAMLLAERTDEHLALFKEGIEAEFYSETDELLEKAKYYLAHDHERKKIAEKGRQRALAEYTWEEVMKEAVQSIESMVRRKKGGAHG